MSADTQSQDGDFAAYAAQRTDPAPGGDAGQGNADPGSAPTGGKTERSEQAQPSEDTGSQATEGKASENEAESATSEDRKAKRRARTRKRQLRAQRKQRAEAAQWKERAEKAEAALGAQPQSPQYPLREHYPDDQSFEDDVRRWESGDTPLRQRRTAAAPATADPARAAPAPGNAQDQQRQAAMDDLEEIIEDHDDGDLAERFKDGIDAGEINLTDPMLDWLANEGPDLDDGEKVVCAVITALTDKPRQARRIARMTPERQMEALDSLAEKLMSPSTQAKKPKREELPEGQGLRGVNPSTAPDRNPSFEDFEAMRDNQEKAKTGGRFQFGDNL